MMKDDEVVVEVENAGGNVDETEEPSTGASSQGGVRVGVGKYKIHVSDRQLPLVGVFFAGMVLLIAVCVSAQGSKHYAYGVAVAAVAMFFSFLGLILTLKENLNDTYGKFNLYFLFAWCFIGACILTFSSPFTATGNGYFASWGLVIFCLMGVGLSGDSIMSDVVGLGSLLGLGASAIIVIVASAFEMNGFWRNESIYALVVACLTVIVVALFASEKGIPGTKFYILLFFTLLWIVLACLVTFRGPFLVTGNGYFGSWGGAVTSVFATMSALKE